MPALHPAPRSPIQSPLISQPRPSPYLRGVNFRAATGSRLVDIPAHSSDKPLPLSCIFTRPCCRLIHQQEIYTCMLDTHLRLYLLRCAAFHSVFFFFSLFFRIVSFRSPTKRPLFVRPCSRVSFFLVSFPCHLPVELILFPRLISNF